MGWGEKEQELGVWSVIKQLSSLSKSPAPQTNVHGRKASSVCKRPANAEDDAHYNLHKVNELALKISY